MDPADFEYDFDAPDSDWNYEPSRAELFRQVDAALYTTDPDGRLTYYNEAAAALWGRRPVLGLDRWCGAWRLYDADGAPLAHERCPMALTLREGREVRGAQAVLERPDGTRVTFMPYPTLLRDRTGAVVGGASILLEVRRPARLSIAREEGVPRERERIIGRGRARLDRPSPASLDRTRGRVPLVSASDRSHA
ncbi:MULTISPECIES: PAS domain-containing protein [Methylobacterium]|uniref:PAS domain-containing protein n=1 Tax=Methylobacterium TaxID=407 RepID=UPI001FE17B16|nr:MULTISPECIES: PAS domain-containing protein [Methylobacterium]MDR7035912.1 PAS domain-containing protein [Methylobacterium sp. BE186]